MDVSARYVHREILNNNRDDLCHIIYMKGALLNKLRTRGVLQRSTEEHIMCHPDTSKQVGELLNFLLQRPLEDYKIFCQCLREDKQGHVVDDYLPDINLRIQYAHSGISSNNDDTQLVIDELVETYIRDRKHIPLIPWEEYRHCGELDDLFTNLSLFIEKPQGGGIEEIPLHSMQNIFDPDAKGFPCRRIILRGEAGVGKTTLVNMIAVQWAENKVTGNATYRIPYNSVFALSLRAVEKNDKLTTILLEQLFADESDVSAHVLDGFLKANASKTLMILDGYDEYRDQSPDIQRLIDWKMYRQMTVIITTRPSRMPQAHNDRLISIEGFPIDSVYRYIERFFSYDPEEGSLLKNLLNQISLSGIENIPILLLLLCILYKNSKSLPRTKSILYDKMVKFMYERHMQKFPESPLPPLQNVLRTLGILALANLLCGNLEFEVNRRDASIDCALKIGLLRLLHTKAKLNRASHGYVYFVHKTFQEYCAAYYLVNFDCQPFIDGCQQVSTVFLLESTFEWVWTIVGDDTSGDDNVNVGDLVSKLAQFFTKSPVSRSSPSRDRAICILRHISDIAIKNATSATRIGDVVYWKDSNDDIPTDQGYLWSMLARGCQLLKEPLIQSRLVTSRIFYFITEYDYGGNKKLLKKDMKLAQQRNNTRYLTQTHTPVILEGQGGFDGDSLKMNAAGGEMLVTFGSFSPMYTLNLCKLKVVSLRMLQLDFLGFITLLRAPILALHLFIVTVKASEDRDMETSGIHPCWQCLELCECNFPEKVSGIWIRILSKVKHLRHFAIFSTRLPGIQHLLNNISPPQTLREVTFGRENDADIAQWIWKCPQLEKVWVHPTLEPTLALRPWPSSLHLLEIGGYLYASDLIKLLPWLTNARHLRSLSVGVGQGWIEDTREDCRLSGVLVRNPLPIRLKHLELVIHSTYGLTVEDLVGLGRALSRAAHSGFLRQLDMHIGWSVSAETQQFWDTLDDILLDCRADSRIQIYVVSSDPRVLAQGLSPELLQYSNVKVGDHLEAWVRRWWDIPPPPDALAGL